MSKQRGDFWYSNDQTRCIVPTWNPSSKLSCNVTISILSFLRSEWNSYIFQMIKLVVLYQLETLLRKCHVMWQFRFFLSQKRMKLIYFFTYFRLCKSDTIVAQMLQLLKEFETPDDLDTKHEPIRLSRKMLNSFVTSRLISKQETSCELLGLDLFRCTESFRHIHMS